MKVTWNVTHKRRRYKKADILVLSVAKSGRTWLRVLVSKYLSLHYGVDFSIAERYQPVPEMPRIMYSHGRWSHIVESTWSQQLFGKNIVPKQILFEKTVIMLVRDPRDLVVSLFFEKTKRAENRVHMPIAQFIKDPIYGIDCIVNSLNHWHRQFESHPHCLWRSYEALKADTGRQLAETLRFMGIPDVKNDLVRQAVEYADFKNMKKMEAKDTFNTPILRPGDTSDPNSYKVREGKVGGYARHFDSKDLRYLEDRMTFLDSFFGYKTTSAIGGE